jgi:hypothetical protein
MHRALRHGDLLWPCRPNARARHLHLARFFDAQPADAFAEKRRKFTRTRESHNTRGHSSVKPACRSILRIRRVPWRRFLAETRQSCPGSDDVSTFRGEGRPSAMSLPCRSDNVSTFRGDERRGAMSLPCPRPPTFQRFATTKLGRDRIWWRLRLTPRQRGRLAPSPPAPGNHPFYPRVVLCALRRRQPPDQACRRSR